MSILTRNISRNKTSRQPNGVSLHIGLNRIDSSHYGTDGQLSGCENDTRAMEKIANTLGYQTRILLTADAKANDILQLIGSASNQLTAGDTFLLTYAGHGSQIQDTSNDEPSGLDSTWCVYDRMIIDDELNEAFSRFRPGVLIVLVSDSCHSGTMDRPLLLPRRLLPAVAQNCYHNHPEVYQRRRSRSLQVAAGVIELAACQDNQVCADGETNGLFTENLLKVWNDGNYQGSYKSFLDRIASVLKASGAAQTPNFEVDGIGATFASRRPFYLQDDDLPSEQTAPVSDQKAPAWANAPGSGSNVWADDAPTWGGNDSFTTTISAATTTTKTKTTKQEKSNMTLIDNGNWEEVLQFLSERAKSTRGLDDVLPRVITANARAAETAYFGQTGNGNGADLRNFRDGSLFQAYWWGFHVQISPYDLQSLLNATDPNGPVANFLRSILPADYQRWISIIAPFVSASAALLRGLDRGRGIYISMSWFAPGVLVPTSA
jgi:hypothetical protein